MKMMLAVVAASVCALGVQQATTPPAMHDAAARTYEHLATAIIEIRATEDSLVEGILLHYRAMARRHLEAAAAASGAQRVTQLEQAAEEITNVANEGDKQVQAIRQRLLKAGHHHHTDAETEDDYMFIDGREKAELLALAARVSRLDAATQESAIRAAIRDLDALTDRALAPE